MHRAGKGKAKAKAKPAKAEKRKDAPKEKSRPKKKVRAAGATELPSVRSGSLKLALTIPLAGEEGRV